MIQRLSLPFSVTAIILAAYMLVSANYNRIGYVDSTKLLNQSQAMLDARSAYKDKAAGWQSNIDTLSSEVQRTLKQYEQSSASSSTKERKILLELLQTKQRQLVQYQRTMQETAQQEDAKQTQLVVNQVNAFLTDYGKSHKYDLILVASQVGTIAYARDGLDLTDEIVEKLNKQYSKSK